MIEINLLPEDLRVKTKVKPDAQMTVRSPGAVNLDKLFVYAIPALLGILISAHLYFGLVSMLKNGQLDALNKKWLLQAPQKKVLDEFNGQFSSSSLDANFSQILSKQRIIWAQKLNELSLNLPSGVWFTELAMDNKSITIFGSVISLQKDEVVLINKFLDSLKADEEFSKDFSAFELSNVQKKSLGGYDIADFILTGTLKAK